VKLLRVAVRPKRAFCVLLGLAVPAVGLAVPAAGLDKPVAPALTREHVDATGSFSFRTPEGWTVSSPRPEVVEAEGDSLLVRFVSWTEDHGFDVLHVTCMQDRLADAMESDPRVQYEYDFHQAEAGDKRLLDSAFRTRYDKPVKGHREWRQRNLTFVSSGRSLCVIAYSPLKLWKGSAQARALLDGIVKSVSTR
jgi:hypothetical protein